MNDETNILAYDPARQGVRFGQQFTLASTADEPMLSRIANATTEANVYRVGSLALIEVLDPARCLIFDRDENGHLRTAHRWDAPNATTPPTAPLILARQVQQWWMRLLQTGQLPRSSRPALLQGPGSAVVAPLLAGDLLHGLIALQDCRRSLDYAAEREITAIVTTMSLTLHTLVLRARLAEAVLPDQVAEVITQERRRIAREIHDGVAQSLGYLLLKVELLDRLVERDPVAAHEQTAVLRTALQSAIGELRRCIGDLRRPSSPEETASLTGQLRSLVSALGDLPHLELALQQVSGIRLDPEIERTVIGIVREALANIRKHANASAVRVEVRQDGEELRVLVADDGQGFQPTLTGESLDLPLQNEHDRHFGVKQMRELAQELGGSLTITSQPGAGARVEAIVPLRPGANKPG